MLNSNSPETPNAFAPPRANLEGPALGVGSDQLSPAERMTRLGAALLDGLIFVPCGILLYLGGAVGRQMGQGMNPVMLAIAGLVGLVIGVYQIYLLSTRGQTLGKRWTGIKIVKLDGSNPGFVGAFLLRLVVPGVISAIPILGGLFRLVDILFIFRDDRRCIHDLIATTRVVRAVGP